MAQTAEANPMSDLMFDWVSVLHSKAEGLHAYEQYIHDAEKENATECVRMLRKLHDQDAAQVREIKEHVAKMMARK